LVQRHVHNNTVGCGCAAEAWSWAAVVIAPIRADRVVAKAVAPARERGRLDPVDSWITAEGDEGRLRSIRGQ
jgi:hypothetical protein